MAHPDIVKEQLNRAIIAAMEKSGAYCSVRSPGFIRNRKLPMEKVIKLLLSMDGGSLQRELYKNGCTATASAFSQRRAKLHPMTMEDVFHYFNLLHPDEGTYKNFQLLAVDGTVVNCARNEQSPTFTWDGNRGYSAFHVTTLYDLLASTWHSYVITPQSKQDEIGDLLYLLSWYDFDKPTIIIGDRLYSTYNTLCSIQAVGADYVIRTKDATSKTAMRPVKQLAERLGNREYDVDQSFVLTTSQTNEDKREGRIFIQTGSKKGKVNSPKTAISRFDFPSPWPVTCRIVRYQLQKDGPFYTLLTSLPREKFSTEEVISLYSYRWKLELAYRCLKYSLSLANLKSKKDDYIKQEITAAMIMQNYVSRIVSGVVLQQNDANRYKRAINFKMAVTLCKDFFRNPDADGEQLMREIARYTEPIRPNRQDERLLKTKSFPGFCYRIAA